LSILFFSNSLNEDEAVFDINFLDDADFALLENLLDEMSTINNAKSDEHDTLGYNKTFSAENVTFDDYCDQLLPVDNDMQFIPDTSPPEFSQFSWTPEMVIL